MSEDVTQRATAVNEFKAVYKLLHEDVLLAEAMFDSMPHGFASRAHVRTYFAYVEGVANAMKQVALASLDGMGVLSVAESDALQDRKRKTSETGEVQFSKSFLPMEDGLKLALKCYAKVHGILDYKPLYGVGWEKMKASLGIRNRVTHPKSVADLMLSAEDIACIDDARDWWHGAVKALLEACEAEDKRLQGLHPELTSVHGR